MSKEKLLMNLEDGLLYYYLEKDHSVDNNNVSEPDEVYEGRSTNYQSLAKQILYKARINLNKDKVANIISIAVKCPHEVGPLNNEVKITSLSTS
jgi:hypothetical protein